MMNVRETALKLLLKTFREDAYSNYLFESAVSNAREWARADRGFLKALYFGVLRQMILLDHLIAGKCRSPYAKVPDSIKMLIRMGLFQILFMDRVPHSAAVSEAVTLAKKYGHKGTAGMVNAILRRFSEEKPTLATRLEKFDHGDPAQIALFTSHPQWLVERYIGEFGLKRTLETLSANNGVPAKNFRVLDWNRVEELGANAGVGIDKNLFNKIGFKAENIQNELIEKFKYEKIAFPQDESSLVAVSLLDGVKGDGLELCCGRGNKTGALLQYIDKQSNITAIDSSVNKLRALEEINSSNINRIKSMCCDVLKPLPFSRTFDWIFLDAPCSNLGIIRRHPEIKYRKTPETVRECAAIQTLALSNASRYLAPGGRLLFAVCSIEREETVEVVERFLAGHSGHGLVDVPSQRPDLAGAGLTDGRCLRILPGSHGMDGFFAALIEKVGG